MNNLNKEQVNQILTDLKKYWDQKLTELKTSVASTSSAIIISKEWEAFFVNNKLVEETVKRKWLATGLSAEEAQKAWTNGWKNAKYPIVQKKIPNYDYQFKGSGITIDNFQVDVLNVDQDQLNFSCHLLTDIKKANSLTELEIVTEKRITDLKDELLPEGRKQADLRKALKEKTDSFKVQPRLRSLSLENYQEQEKVKTKLQTLLTENNLQDAEEVSSTLAQDTFFGYWTLIDNFKSQDSTLVSDYEDSIREWETLRQQEVNEWELTQIDPRKRTLVVTSEELKKEYAILGITDDAHSENRIIREVVRIAHIIVNRFRLQRIRKLFANKDLKTFDEGITAENKVKGLKAELFPRYNLKFVWTDINKINAGNKAELEARKAHLGTNSGLCGNEKWASSQQTTLWIQLRHVNGVFSPALTFNTLAHEMTHSAVGSGWVNHFKVKKEYLDRFKGGNFYLDLDEAKIDHVFGSHTPLFWIYFMDRTVNGLGASTAEFVYGELKDTSCQEEFGRLSSIKTLPTQYNISDIFKCYYSDVRHETNKDTCLTSPFMDGDTASREWYSVMSKVCDITTKSLEEGYNTTHGVVDIVQNSPEFKLEAKKGIEKYLGFDLRALRGDASNAGKFYFKLYLSEHNLNGTTIWNELLKKGWTKTINFILTPKPTI